MKAVNTYKNNKTMRITQKSTARQLAIKDLFSKNPLSDVRKNEIFNELYIKPLKNKDDLTAVLFLPELKALMGITVIGNPWEGAI